MTPESKRDRAPILRTKSRDKARAVARALIELARELEAQADWQERAALKAPDGTKPGFVPGTSGTGWSHEAQ